MSGGTEPLILNVGTRWTESLALLAGRCDSGEIASVSIGFWLGRPTSSVDTLGKRNICCLCTQSARSLVAVALAVTVAVLVFVVRHAACLSETFIELVDCRDLRCSRILRSVNW